MKIIDMNTWERKKTYDWFASFSNPTYSMTVRLDITEYINFKKEYGRNFYADFLYLATKALNSVPALRQRIEDFGVVEYESPDPSVTVLMPDGTFDVCRFAFCEDAEKFVACVKQNIEHTVKYGGNKEFGDENNSVYYFSCVPWVDYTRISDPIPDDIKNATIPRISWGKYVQEGDRWKISFNVCVNHALVDGKHLSDVINNMQQYVNDCKKIFLK